MNIYSVYLCYQPIKNMKYIGPKAIVPVSLKKQNKPLLQHNIAYMETIFGDSMHHHVVVGFDGEKVLRCIGYQDNIGYRTVPDYKVINHGKIIADLIKKYNPEKYSGMFINTDISCILTKPLDIDPEQNYIMCFDDNYAESDITCNVIDNKIEHISFNSSEYYWSGICYLNNATIKLLKFINTIKFTDPMFTWEIINYLKDQGVIFNLLSLHNRQYKYISNDMLKSTKATK